MVGPLTYTCGTCKAAFNIVCVGPTNVVGSPLYCPRCATPFGIEEHQLLSNSVLWEKFADKFELTVDLAKRIYSMWDVNDPHTPTFADHLRLLQEEQ